MSKTEFDFDVAFSFLEKDEKLALSLSYLLKDRLHCFIYSEQQKILAGINRTSCGLQDPT